MATFPARAYENPDEHVGMHERRAAFFAVVHLRYPKVRNRLHEEALPLYRPLYDQWRTANPTAPHFIATTMGHLPTWPTFQHANPAYDPPEHLQLRDALLEWSKDCRLKDDWCLEAAVENLVTWSACDDLDAGPLVYRGERMIELPFSKDEQRFQFEHSGWHVTLEDWSTAKARIEESFRCELAKYKARLSQLAHGDGLVRPARDRPAAQRGDSLEWLARYVVNRETGDEIANTIGVVGRRAVEQAVRAEAIAIGLTIPRRQTPLRS